MSLVQQSKIPIKTSNLKAAIKQLDGQSYRIDEQHDRIQAKSFNAVHVAAAIVEPICHSKDLLAGAISTAASRDDAQVPQNQQLIEHVSKKKSSGSTGGRSSVSVWNSRRQVANQQQTLDAKQTDLMNKKSSCAPQFELLQFQNELIDSQSAARKSLINWGFPITRQRVKSLQFKLNHRFDHVMIVWRDRQLHEQLAENLTANLTIQIEFRSAHHSQPFFDLVKQYLLPPTHKVSGEKNSSNFSKIRP